MNTENVNWIRKKKRSKNLHVRIFGLFAHLPLLMQWETAEQSGTTYHKNLPKKRMNIMQGTDTCTSIHTNWKALPCACTDRNHLLKNDNFQWWSNRICSSINSFGRRATSKVTSWLQTSRPQQASAAARDGASRKQYTETHRWSMSFQRAPAPCRNHMWASNCLPPIHISLFLYLQQIKHSGGKAAGIDWLCGYTILSDIS